MSRIKGITIEIDGETKGLNKALEDVNKRSRDIQRELKQVDRLLKFNPGNTELIAQKQKLLGDQVEATREKLERLKAAQDEVTEAFKRGEISEEQYRAFQRELVETESKLKHFESQLEKTQSKWDKFGEKAAQAGERMKRAGDKMQDVGKSMSMKVTAPLTGVAAAAIKVGTDFETSMSNVAAISGATGDDLKKLEAKAREMGATTNKSASEAADALGYLALAGWDVESMLAGIEPMIKLSSAGNIDLARTADLVTDSMSALGVEIHELDEYLDVLSATSQNSNTSIEQLGEAFVTAGGKLRDLGIRFDEGAAALGVMANAGIKGSEAGRGLSAILTNLTAPTGRAKKAMEELGISVFDSNGEFVGIEESLRRVDEALDGMTQEQQAMYKSMIAGKEHAKTFSALMNGLGGDFDKLTEDIDNSKGALDEMYEIMTDNLAGKWNEFKSALGEAGIAIFESMLPALEVVVGFLQKLVDGFNKLPAPVKTAIVVVGSLVAAIGPLLTVLGFMVSNIGVVLTIVPKMLPLLSKLGSLFGLVRKAVLGFNLALLANPITLIVGAIIAAVALIYVYWEPIKEFFINLWESIKEIGLAIWEWLKDAWSSAVEFIKGIWEPIAEFFINLWDGIKDIFSKFWDWLVDVFFQYTPLGIIIDNWDVIREFFADFWEKIKGIFTNALDAVKDFLSSAWDWIKETTSNVWNKIKDFLSGIWDGVKEVASTIWEGIKNVIMKPVNWIREKTIENFTRLRDSVIEIWNKVRDRAREIFNNLKETVMKPINAIRDRVVGAFTNMRERIANIWNGIKEVVKEPINSIIKMINKFIGGLNKLKAPDWVPVVGGKSINIPTIPMLAKGGRVFGDGAFIAGEEGPELFEKRGSQVKVIPLSPREKQAGISGAVGGDIIINIENMNVRNDDDINKISRELQRLIERARRGRGGGI